MERPVAKTAPSQKIWASATYGKLVNRQRTGVNFVLTRYLHDDDDGWAKWTTYCWLWKTF